MVVYSQYRLVMSKMTDVISLSDLLTFSVLVIVVSFFTMQMSQDDVIIKLKVQKKKKNN